MTRGGLDPFDAERVRQLRVLSEPRGRVPRIGVGGCLLLVLAVLAVWTPLVLIVWATWTK